MAAVGYRTKPMGLQLLKRSNLTPFYQDYVRLVGTDPRICRDQGQPKMEEAYNGKKDKIVLK